MLLSHEQYLCSHNNENNENSFNQKVWYDYIRQKKEKGRVCVYVCVYIVGRWNKSTKS